MGTWRNFRSLLATSLWMGAIMANSFICWMGGVIAVEILLLRYWNPEGTAANFL